MMMHVAPRPLHSPTFLAVKTLVRRVVSRIGSFIDALNGPPPQASARQTSAPSFWILHAR